ncbi:MAG: hypothetical protein XXXJIFNMEKO3_02383 [Candidatus Erwinia impunctatus]|nr:hypothetical protein XXXJIFNMEKO_02383 [Culicoides impunctatus]
MNTRLSKCFLIIGAVCVLSACSTTPPKKGAQKASSQKVANTASSNTAKQQYMERQGAVFNGVTIASTNNPCVDHFNFLKETNAESYQGYSQQYSKISQNYTFLNVNKNIMDKDAKENLTMTLNMKLDTLCSKLQYSGYQVVKDRIKSLSDI